MRFKAHYFSQLTVQGDRKDFWRTIDADNLDEATQLAKRYRRKGYCLGVVVQDLTYTA